MDRRGFLLFGAAGIAAAPLSRKEGISPSQAAGNVVNQRDAVSVKDKDAVGNGVTNDKAAITAAFAASNHVHFPSGTYYLGRLSNSNTVFDISNSGGPVTISTDGEVRILCETIGSVTPKIFRFTNINGLRIGSLHFQGLGYGHAVTNGAIGISIESDAATTVKNVDIDALYGEDMLACLFVIGNSTSMRAERINVGLIVGRNVTYPFNCQNNGDGVKVGMITSTKCTRAYFVYGCRGHDVSIDSQDEDASSGNCILAAYSTGLDTTDIKIHYKTKAGSTGYVAIAMQFNGEGSKKIQNIDIDCDIDMGALVLSDVILLRAYDITGVENTGATNNIYDKIRIRGRILAPRAATRMRIGCRPTTKGQLTLTGIPHSAIHNSIRAHFNLGP